MKKIKVIQVIPNFEVGGAEKLVLDYLINYDKETMEMKAISLYPYKDTIYTKIAEENGLDIIYLNKRKGIDFKVIKSINKIVKEYRPDVIHSHLYSLKYVVLPCMLNKIKKRYHTIHSEPEKDAYGIDKIINKICFKYLKFIPISLHEKARERIHTYYNIKSSIVVENGVNISAIIDDRINEQQLRKSLNIEKDAFIIGHIGTFKEAKNHDFIIDVFEYISRINPNSYLILVGNGPLEEKIKDKVRSLKIEEKVKFLGTRSDIPKILKVMDVFLFPSIYEGFPISLIEAQVAGVRAVTSMSIDENIIISDSTSRLSLNDSISEWSNIIINGKSSKKNHIDISRYDIKNVLKYLEEIYRM